MSIDYDGKALDVHLADLRPLRDALDHLLTILEGDGADLDPSHSRP